MYIETKEVQQINNKKDLQIVVDKVVQPMLYYKSSKELLNKGLQV